MPSQARIVWDPSFTKYNFGPTHPMAPIRLDLTARLCEALGLFDAPGVEVRGAEPASEELLETVHDPDYVAAVKAASADPTLADPNRGIGTEDDPAFVGMHESSARIVTGTVDVVRAVWEGESSHGVNFTGGLHHAMPDRASGFCIYNDIAVGIQWLLDHGAERIAYVDVDVHHGDGVERIFWDDPRVLTISLHETGAPYSRGPAGRPTSAVRRPRGAPSTCPCRRDWPTRAGSGRSTPPSCRSSAPSSRTS